MSKRKFILDKQRSILGRALAQHAIKYVESFSDASGTVTDIPMALTDKKIGENTEEEKDFINEFGPEETEGNEVNLEPPFETSIKRHKNGGYTITTKTTDAFGEDPHGCESSVLAPALVTKVGKKGKIRHYRKTLTLQLS